MKSQLKLEQKPCGDIWLHVINKPKECQASINLGKRDGTIVGKALLTAIESQTTKPRYRKASSMWMGQS